MGRGRPSQADRGAKSEDILHLLIKEVVYYKESQGGTGERTGNIKMDLWELPPLYLLNLPVKSFTESLTSHPKFIKF